MLPATRMHLLDLRVLAFAVLPLASCVEIVDPAGPADLRSAPPPDLVMSGDATPSPDLMPLPITWSARTSGTTRALHAIWGSGANDLFVAGEAGTILHSTDGKNFAPMNSGTGSMLRAIRGAGSKDVFAVGDEGVILHHDGTAWSSRGPGVTASLNGLWYTGGPDVWVAGAGGLVLHSTDSGTTWTEPMAQRLVATTFRAMWGWDKTIWAVGDGGNTVITFDGGANWRLRWIASTENIQAMWSASPSEFFLVSDEGSLRGSIDGLIWPRRMGNPEVPMRGVWGSTANDVYAVGDRGTIMHSARFDGPFEPQGSGTTKRLNAVWGSDAGDVYAVGEEGTILHRP